jgi:hypothetical protein
MRTAAAGNAIKMVRMRFSTFDLEGVGSPIAVTAR